MENSLSSAAAQRTDMANHAGRGNEAYHSGVSWAAVIAGAFVAASLALIMLALGAGLGLSSVSPWSNSGASAKAIGFSTVVWLLVAQLVAAGMGGYLAGRLRTQWVGVHTDEVFFRDTAHGFLVWAVAAVIGASLLTSAATSMVGAGVQIGSAGVAAGGAAAAAAAGSAGTGTMQSTSAQSGPNDYFVDMLYRSDPPKSDANDPPMRAETARVFSTGLRKGELAPADKTYLAQTVAARTGLSQADAEKRVADVTAQAKRAAAEADTAARQAADAARKAAAYLSLWIFVSMLLGAFAASYAATIGGRQRDRVPAV